MCGELASEYVKTFSISGAEYPHAVHVGLYSHDCGASLEPRIPLGSHPYPYLQKQANHGKYQIRINLLRCTAWCELHQTPN